MNHTKESQARTLQELSPGECGMIVSVGNQSGAVKRRLEKLAARYGQGYLLHSYYFDL